jgi:SAM-dependent methyltransferase
MRLVEPGDESGPVAPSRPCPACGTDARWDALQIREMMFGSREQFDYGRCRNCGSLAISRIPDDLSRFYPPDYYANTAREAVPQESWIRRAAVQALVARQFFGRRRLFAAIARRAGIRPPRQLSEVRDLIVRGHLSSFDDSILDVGSGATPIRLAVLRRLGFQRLLGVDPFVEGDLDFYGVPVRKGHLEDIEGTFQLITFHHSLEHISDPLGTLLAARERLADGGRCLVRTPVADGVMWRTYGTDWVELDAPRHLVVFSRRGLEELARRAGFEVVEMTWESGDWELIASEQYQRDIAMFEPSSWFAEPGSATMVPKTATGYKDAARRMNAQGDAGRAAFWLRRAAAGN